MRVLHRHPVEMPSGRGQVRASFRLAAASVDVAVAVVAVAAVAAAAVATTTAAAVVLCPFLLSPRPSHLAVKSCLTRVASLHGSSVTTTEGLGGNERGKKLHPVQERLWKAHGSQCGFCSPGTDFNNSLESLKKLPGRAAAQPYLVMTGLALLIARLITKHIFSYRLFLSNNLNSN